MKPVFFAKAIRALLYAEVIGVPLVFFGHMLFPFGVPKVVLFESLAALMGGCWLALLALEWPSRRHLPRLTPLLVAVLVFGAALLLSSLFGADIARSMWSSIDRMTGVVAILHFVLFYVVLAGLKDEINWTKVWLASFMTSGTVGLSVLLSKWGLWSFFLKQGSSRPGGLFGNSTFAGAYMLFNVYLAVWLWSKFRGTWSRAFIILGAALQIIGMLLGQTIGILLGLLAGIAFLLIAAAWRGEGRTRRNARAVIVAGLILLFIVFLTRDAGFWQKVPGFARLTAFSTGQSDVHDRLLAWKAALSAFRDRPVLGWGWENFNVPFNAHYDPKLLVTTLEGTFFDKPHNVFLEYLATGGILGILTYLGLLAAFGYELWHGARRRGEHLLALALAAAGAAYVVQVSIAFDTLGTYLMLFLLFAAADALYAPSNGKDISEAEKPLPSAPRQVAAGALVVLSFLPIFFLQIPTFNMANQYFWGINYFLNNLTEASGIAWHEALAAKTPYQDYVRKDYASVIQQGFQQSMSFPNMDTVVKEGAAGLEAAVKDHPKDYFFHLALADYYVIMKPFGGADYLAKAKEQINDALALSPKRQQVYYVLSREKLMENDKAGAIAALQQAVDLNPDAGDPHFTLGMLAYGLGDTKTGDREIARAKELGRTPRSVQEAENLAGFVGDLEGNYKEAIDYLKLAVYLAEQGTNDRVLQEAELKLGVGCYLGGDNNCARDAFNWLKDHMDLKTLPIWPNLKPVLDGLGVKY